MDELKKIKTQSLIMAMWAINQQIKILNFNANLYGQGVKYNMTYQRAYERREELRQAHEDLKSLLPVEKQN